ADRRGGLATLLVHRSSHPEDSDLVVLDDADRAFAWSRRDDPRRSGSGGLPGALGNAGVAVLHRDLLQRVPRDRSSDIFRDIMPPLVEARAPVFGYRTPEYVRDMGTPPRLDAVRQDLEMGRVHPKADLVLLDRDGVLIEDVDGLTRPEQIRLLPGTGEALRRFAAAGVATAVVTNQSIVARGLASVDDLDRIHARLRQLLAAEGAQVGDILYCPHHHETHHGEGIDALRGPCSCRKPSAELLHRAIAAADVPAWRAIMIGDRTSDVQAAHNAGLSALGVDTGMGLGDDRCPARPTFRFADLEAASRWLCPPATQRRRV
ncbi:MAG: HAD-IIIA family hydrolase, partial [Acidobacteriota bacterium]